MSLEAIKRIEEHQAKYRAYLSKWNAYMEKQRAFTASNPPLSRPYPPFISSVYNESADTNLKASRFGSISTCVENDSSISSNDKNLETNVVDNSLLSLNNEIKEGEEGKNMETKLVTNEVNETASKKKLKCKPGLGKLNRATKAAQIVVALKGHGKERFKRDYEQGTATYSCPKCALAVTIALGKNDAVIEGEAVNTQCSGLKARENN